MVIKIPSLSSGHYVRITGTNTTIDYRIEGRYLSFIILPRTFLKNRQITLSDCSADRFKMTTTDTGQKSVSYFTQLKAMLWRNFLIKKRNRRTIAVSITRQLLNQCKFLTFSCQ